MIDADRDLHWLREHRPVIIPPSEEVTAHIRASLLAGADTAVPLAHLAVGSRRKVVIRASASAVLAGAAATAVVFATAPVASRSPGSTHGATGTLASGAPAGHPGAGHPPILIRLADQVLASPTPAGDATLVLRSQVVNGGAPIPGADLYTDSGRYYYAPTESGLPAAVSAGNNQGDGVFAREIAAAEQAATASNLPGAAHAIEVAPDPATSSLSTATATGTALLANNWLWENSQDALVAGAGNPTVRAGVMRLISTLPEVKVTNTTANRQAAVQITATFPNVSKCAVNGIHPGASDPALQKACASLVGGGFQEQLTINATTGIPISFSGGAPGQPPASRITYQVSRVTLSQVAQGHFVATPTGAPGRA